MPKYNGKYDLLKKHLQVQSAPRVHMNFSDVERIVGERLPRSAKLYRTWWSNDASHHVQASAWLDAGYRTEHVDMENHKLAFVRANGLRGMAEESKMFSTGDKNMSERHPLIGAMKGTFTIEDGWDLTKPALDPEELKEWEANLDRMADELQEALARKQ